MTTSSSLETILPLPAGSALFPDLTRDDVFRLETPRLWLRWLRHRDAADLARFAGLAAVAEMTGSWPHPLPPGEAERRIFEARKANATGARVILGLSPRNRPDRLIGVIGLSPDPDEPIGLDLGYMLDPSEQGRGLMTEAVQAILNTAFDLTTIAQVSAWTRVINPASRRVLEKSGFRHIGTGLRSLPARGGMLPCEHYVIDRKTWGALSGWTRGPGRGQPRATADSAAPDGAATDADTGTGYDRSGKDPEGARHAARQGVAHRPMACAGC